MSKEELIKTLAGLRSEISGLELGDEQVKDRLNRLIIDIEHQIENPDDTEHKLRLFENLSKINKQFEVEHPHLTGILNQVMVTLSNMGI